MDAVFAESISRPRLLAPEYTPDSEKIAGLNPA